MARIRTLKPEYWTDEKMSLLDPLTRLVFLALVSLADDAGRLIDNVKLLDGQMFPNTDDSCEEALETLARLSRITRYRSASGQPLIQVAKWADHQRVDHPSAKVLPAPPADATAQPVVRPILPQTELASSRKSRENLATGSRDTRASTLDLGPRNNGAQKRAPKYPNFSSEMCDRLYTAWSALGRPEYSAFRGAFGRLFPEKPPYTIEQLEAAIAAYISDAKAEDQAKYATPRAFVDRVQHYVEMTTPLAERDPARAFALGVAS